MNREPGVGFRAAADYARVRGVRLQAHATAETEYGGVARGVVKLAVWTARPDGDAGAVTAGGSVRVESWLRW